MPFLPPGRLPLSLALATQLVAQVQKPNFSGVWKTVPSKSTANTTQFEQIDLSALAIAPALPLLDRSPETIEHKGDQFTTRGRTAAIDAPETAGPAGESGLVRISRTYWYGNQLVTEWRLERDGRRLIQCWEVRRLSASGKTQIVDTHIESPQERRDSRSVLVKKR